MRVPEFQAKIILFRINSFNLTPLKHNSWEAAPWFTLGILVELAHMLCDVDYALPAVRCQQCAPSSNHVWDQLSLSCWKAVLFVGQKQNRRTATTQYVVMTHSHEPNDDMNFIPMLFKMSGVQWSDIQYAAFLFPQSICTRLCLKWEYGVNAHIIYNCILHCAAY